MRSIIDYFRRLNEALPMLLTTIVAYGLLVLVVGVWFFPDKEKYIVGLLFGIGQAVFLSISIASSILGAVEVADKKGQVAVAIKSTFRYLVVVALTFFMCYFNLGYIGTWFAGVMGLKVAALLQPLIHRVLEKIRSNSVE